MALPFQERAKALYLSNAIQISVALLIGVNFVVSACAAQVKPQPDTSEEVVFKIFEWFFGIIFSVELVLNLYGHWWKEFWSSAWNQFDFVIVLISLLSMGLGNLPGISVLRLFRAFRVFRLFKRIESLRLIIEGVLKSLPGVANAFVVVMLIASIWSIIGVNFFADDFPEFFSTFFAGLFTLFQVMTGDSWCSGIARPVVLKHGPIAFIYFLTYMFIAGILMTNVVVAILLERFLGAVKEAEEEREAARKIEEERALALTRGGGSVEMKILQAADLKGMDVDFNHLPKFNFKSPPFTDKDPDAKGTNKKPQGVSDPYVKVMVNGQREVFKTTVMERTVNPVWEQSCRFTVGKEETFLVMELFDHDLTSADDSLGQVTLHLDQHVGDSLKDAEERWFDVEASAGCKEAEGKLCLRLAWRQPTEEDLKREADANFKGRHSMLDAFADFTMNDSCDALQGMSSPLQELLLDDNKPFDEVFHQVHTNITMEVDQLRRRIEGVRRVLASKEMSSGSAAKLKGPWKAAFAAQDGDIRFFCGQDKPKPPMTPDRDFGGFPGKDGAQTLPAPPSSPPPQLNPASQPEGLVPADGAQILPVPPSSPPPQLNPASQPEGLVPATTEADEAKKAAKDAKASKKAEPEAKKMVEEAAIAASEAAEEEQTHTTVCATTILEEREQILSFFRTCDSDHTGYLSKDEMRVVLTSIGGVFAQWAGDEFEQLFAQVDQNSDGNIQYDEFVDWLFACIPATTEDGAQTLPAPPSSLPPQLNPASQPEGLVPE